MNITNDGILNPEVTEPNGYVTSNLEWAAVPYGSNFVIVHKGAQVHTTRTLQDAKDYIAKKSKVKRTRKPKKGAASLEQFL